MLGPHPLIGIMGRKRSGKDASAARLIAAHGYTRFALADPMRAALLALDPVLDSFGPHTFRLSDLVEDVGWEAAKEDGEVRRLLQRFGTEMGRQHFGEDFWVDLAFRQIDAFNGPVVVTDVRFPNEAEAIESRGGVLLHLERPSLPVNTDSHASENALADFTPHAVIVNDGDLDDLANSVDDFAMVVSERARPTLSTNKHTEEIQP